MELQFVFHKIVFAQFRVEQLWKRTPFCMETSCHEVWGVSNPEASYLFNYFEAD